MHGREWKLHIGRDSHQVGILRLEALDVGKGYIMSREIFSEVKFGSLLIKWRFFCVVERGWISASNLTQFGICATSLLYWHQQLRCACSEANGSLGWTQ